MNTSKPTAGGGSMDDHKDRLAGGGGAAPLTIAAQWPSVVQRLLLIAPVLGLLFAGWAHRRLNEDGFIYLRVVRQFNAGHGPVFNVGQRVEAFTGTIWTFLLAVVDLVTPFRLEWIAVVLGLLCASAGVALATFGCRRLWSHVEGVEGRWFVPVGALVFVSLLPVWVYVSDGLENGLVYGWLGLSFWILAAWAGRPASALSMPGAVVLGLGWLIRPELALFSGLFLVVVLRWQWQARSWRSLVRVALAMVALPIAYQIFRMGYYGNLVPNTAIAKEGGSVKWSRGTAYLSDFANPYWLWVPLVAVLVGGYLPLFTSVVGRTRAVVAAFVTGAFVEAFYVVLIGGDYLHARLFLPSLFALLAPVAALPLTRRCVAALAAVPWAIVAMFWLKPVQYGANPLAHHIFITLPSQYGTVTIDQAAESRNDLEVVTGPAYYGIVGFGTLRKIDIPLKPDVPLPFGSFFGVGVSGYALPNSFHVLDLHGLADPLTAHFAITPSRIDGPRVPGHEKTLPAPWLAAEITRPGVRLDADDFPKGGNPLIAFTSGHAFDVEVAWARAALRCPAIARITAAADAPMTPRRFFANLVHAFQNTRTRIPPDPKQAYHSFCGPGTPAQVSALERR